MYVHRHVKISWLHRSISPRTTILQKEHPIKHYKNTHAHFSLRANQPGERIEAIYKTTRRQVQYSSIGGHKWHVRLLMDRDFFFLFSFFLPSAKCLRVRFRENLHMSGPHSRPGSRPLTEVEDQTPVCFSRREKSHDILQSSVCKEQS